MGCFKNNKILNTMDEHNKCGRSEINFMGEN